MYARHLEQARSEHEATLCRTGDYTTARYAGRVFSLQHTKGIGDLSQLLARPGDELHVLELIEEAKSAIIPPFAVAASAQDALSVSRRGAWNEPLDARARSAYKARYVELVADLEQAQSLNDVGHVQRLSEELEQLIEQLRQRKYVACAATERARKAVYNRVRAAMAHIGKHDRDFQRHLEVTIKTGITCSYRPELGRYVRAC